MLASPRAAVVAACTLALAAGCAKKIPAHDGYKSTDRAPWKKPKVVELDADMEAEVDDEISYPKRKRARWYAVDLPGDGRLHVTLSYTPVTEPGAEEEDEEFDLAVEILDEPYHRVLMRADQSEHDAFETKKERTLHELARGRYLVHVFAQRRLDAADFTLRLKYEPGAIEKESDFPAQVAFVAPLPVVPVVDDTPQKPRRRGRGGGRPRTKPPEKAPPSGETISGRITNAVTAGGKTRITINRGADKGIDRGWRGAVVNASGKAIPNGDFEVTDCRPRECYAVTGASRDAVVSAARVILRGP